MSLRIALDARTIHDRFPGIARYTYNLALALATVAPDEQLLLLRHASQLNTRFDLAPLRAQPNLALHDTPARTFSLSEQWQVPDWLKRERADLYHSPYYLMPYRTPCPAVVTVHDLIPLLYPQYFTPIQRLVFGVAMRLAVRQARVVIAVSQATARDVQARLRVPVNRISVVPEAADPQMVPAPPETIAAIRTRYGLPDAYVLYIGSNKPHKNLTRLVEAYARVRRRSDVPLVIGGHWDSSHNEPRARAEMLGIAASVRWLGPLPQADLPALFSGAALFVFPSEYEGFGLPVLEAMACGAPVVCSNRSSLSEVAGEAALLLDSRDVDGWVQTIDRLLDSQPLRAQMREASLRRARSFSWLETARQTHSIYQRVARP